MPRRREVPKRDIAADPLYQSPLVSKFINCVMSDGKRSTAERIMYASLSSIQEKTGDDPLKVFKKAVENVKPALEVWREKTEKGLVRIEDCGLRTISAWRSFPQSAVRHPKYSIH